MADLIRRARNPDANVIFGLVQDRRMKKKVKITLVATGIDGNDESIAPSFSVDGVEAAVAKTVKLAEKIVRNGHAKGPLAEIKPLF